MENGTSKDENKSLLNNQNKRCLLNNSERKHPGVLACLLTKLTMCENVKTDKKKDKHKEKHSDSLH